MMYRLSAAIKPIFHVDFVLERDKGSHVEMLIQAHTQSRSQSIAQHVTIRVPVTPDVDTSKA
jgi:predicted RNA binding protein YcfA (HicA-like mRNA interferase family)